MYYFQDKCRSVDPGNHPLVLLKLFFQNIVMHFNMKTREKRVPHDITANLVNIV